VDTLEVRRRGGLGLRHRTFEQSSLGRGGCLDGLLEQPVKEHSAFLRVASVEPEAELIEVGLQVDRLDGALVSPEHPPLGQAGDPVNPWKYLVCLASGAGDAEGLVRVAGSQSRSVGHPAVGDDDRTWFRRCRG